MITGWLLYCVATSALLMAAAALVDGVLSAHRRPVRWVWVIAMLAAFAVPGTAYLMQRRTPRSLPGAAANGSGRAIDMFPGVRLDSASGRIVSARRETIRRPQAPELLNADRIVVDVAILCIALAALRVAIDSLLLYRQRRAWMPDRVDGVDVLMSENIGPALVGLIRPAIVLPRWTMALAPEDRALMLAHEREHLIAGDGRLTTIALLAAICMPWNPVLWWAIRRLRVAIEVDCDRRVLGAFPDVQRYGRLLVEVAQRAVGSSFAIAGFSERAAPLARRIRAMKAFAQPRRRLNVRDMSAAALGALAIIGAVVVLPPEAPARTLDGLPKRAVFLTKSVGDSIAEGEPPTRVVAAAADLPAVFTIVGFGPGRDVPTAGRCGDRLRDDRDGTELQVSMTSSSILGVAQRGDTTWTTVGEIGFYSVRTAGKYGVTAEQRLRVGCGSYTRINVGGRVMTTAAVSSLDMPGDDRARRVARHMTETVHFEPAAVELFAGRLNVLLADSIAPSPRNQVQRDVLHRTFDAARDVLGAAAMPETLTVTIRMGREQWATLYYYKSLAK